MKVICKYVKISYLLGLIHGNKNCDFKQDFIELKTSRLLKQFRKTKILAV